VDFAYAVPSNGQSLRQSLLRSRVQVVDKAGDAYLGVLVAWDESMIRLEGVGLEKVRFADGRTKAELSMDWVNIPTSEIKFVTGDG